MMSRLPMSFTVHVYKYFFFSIFLALLALLYDHLRHHTSQESPLAHLPVP